MPKVNKGDRELIKQLPQGELANIVIKLISKDKNAYDLVYISYLNQETGEKDVYENTLSNINACFYKSYTGRIQSQRDAKMLSACIRELNSFTKISKNKTMEADLIMVILKEAIIDRKDSFGSYFTAFDNKVAQILKILLTIITKKIHPDYLIDYQEDVNTYLKIFSKYSCHNSFTYELPKNI